MTAKGFQLGDHTFLHPSENGPLSRLTAKKRQILGAAPPTLLAGIARQAGPASPAAKNLMKGEFCGHGEPTMTIFDIVIEGQELLDVMVDFGPEGFDPDISPVQIAVRPQGAGTGLVIFRREWQERAEGLESIVREPLDESSLKGSELSVCKGRLAIGFEYPCDATSADSVTWMTADVLELTGKKPVCILDAEMA